MEAGNQRKDEKGNRDDPKENKNGDKQARKGNIETRDINITGYSVTSVRKQSLSNESNIVNNVI